MACYHPSKIDVERRAMAGSPPRRDAVTVPCGSCIGCRSDQGREWAIRLMHEALLHPGAAWFITLTYSPENLPENGSLQPADCQLFFKRFRKKQRNRIRYFLCGEYGEVTDRPHYHAIILGAPLLDKRHIGDRNGFPVWTSQLLESTWEHGLVDVTSVTWKTASYVAGYVTKKAKERSDPTKHLRVDPDTGEIVELTKEFSRMSRRPGLGRDYLERYWRDIYPRDFVAVNGSFFKPPRYYDRAMEDINPELMEEVRFQRWKDAEEIGDDRLIMKEKVHRARMALFESRGAV